MQRWGVQQESKRPVVYAMSLEIGSLRGSFPTVRATAVRWDVERSAERNAILAGDPKMIRLLCNSNLDISIPSRGSEEETVWWKGVPLTGAQIANLMSQHQIRCWWCFYI